MRKINVCLLILLSLWATMATTIIKASPEEPSVYVYPERSEFSTTTTSIGDEFNVTIEAADWPEPGLFSFEFKFYYDPTMLEPVLEKTGIDPDFWITTFVAASGFDFSVDPPQPYEDGEGNPFLWFSATLFGQGGNVGGGILAKAGFQIIAEPATGQTLSCLLSLGKGIEYGGTDEQKRDDVIMVDPTAEKYPEDYYEIIDGIYLFSSEVTPNTPPEASNLVITPSSPRTTDDLVGTYDYYDADGDTESGSEIRWYKDGLLQAAYNDTLTVPSNATSLGEEWYFTVKPSDGQDFGTLETSPTVTIVELPEKREDLNGDGKVNIEDLAIWGAAFGSTQEHPRWNAIADINEDGKIDLIDGVLIAKEFDM